ncbi:hypothetical protein SERN_2987 [Serinibacter arcticus]|uniref:Uncharacterized protein n=1 Tax=Serinibacter arcticus TaxID=1655435 RepID=A0A4Z1E1V3_9MICO|nr:hypothetical protein SERN_2987 [Serinibacter arcticus]
MRGDQDAGAGHADILTGRRTGGPTRVRGRRVGRDGDDGRFGGRTSAAPHEGPAA